MNWFEALILGLVQGLTEYLPVSSSGHLELGKILLGTDPEAGGLMFDVLVHVATVLATLVVLWKEIAWIVRGLLKWQWNDEARYAVAILISMIPIGIVGVLLKDEVEALYARHVITVVGICLIITAVLLFISERLAKNNGTAPIGFKNALIVGVAQACAVLPGLSRSGSTIATGLLLGIDRKRLAEFSFIMVIPPILGEALLDARHLFTGASTAGAEAVAAVSPWAYIVGFLAAFVSGCFACKWMIALVKRCKLSYFALYCLVIGVVALICS